MTRDGPARIVLAMRSATTVDHTDLLIAEINRLGSALAVAHRALETAEARERSRIADDLHDVLGHALEVVAFKAELADRLVDIDAERARGEMMQIQRVARSAMNDVRSLARCRRLTDLKFELIGAVSLFNSAGVEVRVTGDVASVSEMAKDPLARVLREAVTNVLRHANPTRCGITVRQTAVDASVAIVNDGVRRSATAPASGGSGLAGLARLLAEHGGRLSAGHDGFGVFKLSASVATPSATSCAPAQTAHLGRAAELQLAVQR